MKNLKQSLPILLLSIGMLLLAACGGTADPTPQPTQPPVENTESPPTEIPATEIPATEVPAVAEVTEPEDSADSDNMETMVSPIGEIIPFDSDRWVFIANTQVEEFHGQTAINLGVKESPEEFIGFGAAILPDVQFSNGIIEYDVIFDRTITFGGIQFRDQDGSNYEEFYMRAHQSGNPDANQYMPRYNGVPSWQLHYGAPYSVPFPYDFNTWMHVKVVVSGDFADIYIKDMEAPALTVELEREEMAGMVGLWGLNLGGDIHFANFAVAEMDSAEIVGTPVPKADAPPNTIMEWSISNTFDSQSLAGKTTLADDDTSGLTFTTLAAESTGITDLSQLQGVSEANDTVFAKLVIDSDSAQIKKMDFGFSDIVKIYLNGQLLFEAHDQYLTRDYRFLGTVGFYDSVYLDLQEGENEVLIAITEDVADQTGWAVQAKFESMDGITIE